MEKATYDLKKIEHGEALSRAMQEAHANGKRISMEKETLEEAAERLCPNSSWKLGFIKGAEWQAERMYSEEEVQELLIKALTHKDNGEVGNLITVQSEIRTANFYTWFEQFKKK